MKDKFLLVAICFVVISALSMDVAHIQAQSPCVASLNIPNDPPPYGLLARSNLSCAAFQIKGPVEYFGEGFYWPKFEAPLGTYTIVWNSVPGYITPLSETKELQEGGKLLFIGNYNEAEYPQGKGTIEIYIPNPFPPPYPHFTLKGPVTRTGMLNSLWKEEVPPGTYTVTYEDLDDHGAPPAETKTLERNGTIIFSAAYGRPKAHVFLIDSKPSGAAIYLDGSFLGNAPIKAKIPQDSDKHTIRCVLKGYEDYNYYDYRAREPDSTTYSIGAKWICPLVAKKDSPSTQVKELSPQVQRPTPPKESVSPSLKNKEVAPFPLSMPSKPQGFFPRIWKTIFSFFRKQ